MRLNRIVAIVEFLKHVRTITIDVEALRREARRLHKRRRSRKLEGESRISAKRMIEITGQELAVRGRLTEILLDCKLYAGQIERYRRSVVLKVATEYADSIPGTSKTERREWLEDHLDRQLLILDQLRDAIDTCDYLIEDIDQTRVNLQRLTTFYELSTRPGMT